jgi:hypothetical protein
MYLADKLGSGVSVVYIDSKKQINLEGATKRSERVVT